MRWVRCAAQNAEIGVVNDNTPSPDEALVTGIQTHERIRVTASSKGAFEVAMFAAQITDLPN